METTIQIKSVTETEAKVSGRKYFKVDTDQGIMSCFEDKIAGTLSLNIGKSMNVEVQVSGDKQQFKNIRRICADVKTEKPNLALLPPIVQDKFSEAREEKNRTMYVSYVKDLVISGMPYQKAVEIIKAVIKEF